MMRHLILLYVFFCGLPALAAVDLCRNIWATYSVAHVDSLPPPEYSTTNLPHTALTQFEYRTILKYPTDLSPQDLAEKINLERENRSSPLHSSMMIRHAITYAASLTEENPQMPARWRTVAAQRYLVLRELFTYFTTLDPHWMSTDSVLADGSFLFSGSAVARIIVVRFPDGGIFLGFMSDLATGKPPHHTITPDFRSLKQLYP